MPPAAASRGVTAEVDGAQPSAQGPSPSTPRRSAPPDDRRCRCLSTGCRQQQALPVLTCGMGGQLGCAGGGGGRQTKDPSAGAYKQDGRRRGSRGSARPRPGEPLIVRVPVPLPVTMAAVVRAQIHIRIDRTRIHGIQGRDSPANVISRKDYYVAPERRSTTSTGDTSPVALRFAREGVELEGFSDDLYAGMVPISRARGRCVSAETIVEGARRLQRRSERPREARRSFLAAEQHQQ